MSTLSSTPQAVPQAVPQAKPVDTFFKIPNPQEPKPDTRWAELTAALKSFQKPMEQVLDKTFEAHGRYSYAEGKRLASIYNDWNKAIQAGEAHVTDSPFFQQGFLEGQGRLQGFAYQEALNAAYASWEGKNQVEAKTLGTEAESKPFLEFVATVRAPFLEKATNAHWLNGFQPIMEMAESNVSNQHLAYKKAFLEEARYKQLTQEVFSLVKSSGTPQDIVQGIETLGGQATFTGLDPHKTEERLRQATLAAAVELGTRDGGDVRRAAAILNALPQRSAEDKVKINHTLEVLDAHVYTQEGRAHHRIEQARKEASQKAKEWISSNLLKNINWQDSPENIKRMVALGVTEYPFMIEDARGHFNEIPEEVNVQEEHELKKRLYNGTLAPQDIDTTKHLSLKGKEEFHKIKASQKDFMGDPRVTAMVDKVKNHFAPTEVEKMTPGAYDMQYDATATFSTELYRLHKETPGLIADDIAFLNTLQNIANGVIKAFETRQEMRKNLMKQQQEKRKLHEEVSKHFKTKGQLEESIELAKKKKGPLYEMVHDHKMTQEQVRELVAQERKRLTSSGR